VNLLLLQETDHVAGARFRIDGPRARHVREVLGAGPGATLRAGLLDGPLGTATVAADDGEHVVLDLALEAPATPPSGLELVLAIPRPKMLRRLLPQIAAMGVDSIVLLRTWRVEKPYLTAKVLEPETYRPLLHEGLMQGRSTREPKVRVEPLFRPYVEDRMAQEFAGARCLVAHPLATEPLASVAPSPDERVVIAIGPEGGFVPFEIEALSAAGFTPVSMGERTLRVDTATIALLAQIDLLRGAGSRGRL
jgi:RsmE family RNA methyltransferase